MIPECSQQTDLLCEEDDEQSKLDFTLGTDEE